MPTGYKTIGWLGDALVWGAALGAHDGTSGWQVRPLDEFRVGASGLLDPRPHLILIQTRTARSARWRDALAMLNRPDVTGRPVLLLAPPGEDISDLERRCGGTVIRIDEPVVVDALCDAIDKLVSDHAPRLQTPIDAGRTPATEALSPFRPDRLPADAEPLLARLATSFTLAPPAREAIAEAIYCSLHEVAAREGIPAARLSGLIAECLSVPLVDRLGPNEEVLMKLPPSFCRRNSTLILRRADGREFLVLANPFDPALAETLIQSPLRLRRMGLAVAAGSPIAGFLEAREGEGGGDEGAEPPRAHAAPAAGPATRPAPPAPPAPPVPPASESRGVAELRPRVVPLERPSSILVVEDDAIARLLMTRILEEAGHAVDTADDGIDALIRIGRHRFDLILTDIQMPNLDGLRLQALLRQKGFQTPIIVVTGSTDQEAEIEALRLGAADFIRKPISRRLLLARTERILARRAA